MEKQKKKIFYTKEKVDVGLYEVYDSNLVQYI